MPGSTPPDLYNMLSQIVTYFGVSVLSAWGGVVKMLVQVRNGDRCFMWSDLGIQIIVSSFAGMLTYFICEASGITGYMQAAFIAISGHMGAEALRAIEEMYLRQICKDTKDKESKKDD